MDIHFSGFQTIDLPVPEQPIPIQHYLRQPQRLVQALVDPSRVEQLGKEHFRLKMRPLSFLTLRLQPTVDLRVWATPDETLCLQSTACEIRGIEYINQRFRLDLVGQLRPYRIDRATHLRGRADLKVAVELPHPFCLTPRPILETTGNGLLKSILLTMKQRLANQLLLDYHCWVRSQTANLPTADLEGLELSPRSSSI